MKPKEILIWPEHPEIKDRFWTLGKTVICEGGHCAHPEGKHIVLDGRLRSALPEPGDKEGVDKKPASLFFLLPRRKAEVGAELTPNLAMGSVRPTWSVRFEQVGPGPKIKMKDWGRGISTPLRIKPFYLTYVRKLQIIIVFWLRVPRSGLAPAWLEAPSSELRSGLLPLFARGLRRGRGAAQYPVLHEPGKDRGAHATDSAGR